MDYQKSLTTTNGTEVHYVSTPSAAEGYKKLKLYVSRMGNGYSLTKKGLGFIVARLVKSTKQKLSGSSRWGGHLEFKNYRMLVHRAVWTAWNSFGYNKIPPGCEIHHLNGIESDNCIDNLVCLSCGEHKVWDHRMHILRDKLGNLKAVPYDRLRALQMMPTIELKYHIDHLKQDDPEALMNYEITHHVEFLEH